MRFVFAVPLVVLFACAEPNSFTLRSADARIDVTVEPFSFVVRSADGDAVLTSLAGGGFAPTLDRPTYIDQIVPGWDGYQAGDGAWVRGGKVRLVSRTEQRAEVAWDIEGATVRVVLRIDGARVHVESSAGGADGGPPTVRYNKSTLAFRLPEDEHFFGLGERFASFDHRGWSLYTWAEEGPLGGGEGVAPGPTNPYPNGPSMTYFPVPFFLSSKGYALHVNTDFRSELHLGSEQPDSWRVAVNAPAFAFTVYVHDSPLDSLDDFTADTGRPLIPAPWVFGPRRRIGAGSEVDGGAEWQVMRDRQLPLTAVDDAVHFLPALSQVGREVELRAWTSLMHANGFKALAYNNPYVADGPAAAAADWAHGLEKGFFVKKPDGTPATVFLISGNPLTVGMIDFTNPDATAWYRSLLQRTVDFGYDGWMHDFGEYVPRTGRFFDGRRGDEVHNPYPRLSAMAAREVLQAALPDDHLFFVRAGYTGSQAFVPAVWGGDAETSFDETQGIPSTIRSGLNLSMVGVPYWGSDGTGFKCIGSGLRDKEVYVRWLELEAVSPIMMDQNACANPLERKTKWTLWSDEETQDVYRKMAGLHTRLQPYFMVLAREAHERGTPLMRAPFLMFPTEPRTWTLDDAFFLGPALYAAPVLKRGLTTREVWLPPGQRYVELNDFTVHAGGDEVSVPAPLGRLPLFLVEGQLLPMLDPTVQTLAPATVPGVVTAASMADVLDVRVALGPGGKATLTLFDGTQLIADRLADSGGRSGVTDFHQEQRGQVAVTQVTSERAASSSVRFDELSLVSTGPIARRIRWEVIQLQ